MMSLKVVYDQQADVLRLLTSEKGETGSSLFGQDDVVLDLAKEDGYDIVGIAILGASAYLPLGKQGYDTETDTLTLGCSVSDPAMTTENGDLAAYWQVDEKAPANVRDPIGVAIREASKHLATVLSNLHQAKR